MTTPSAKKSRNADAQNHPDPVDESASEVDDASEVSDVDESFSEQQKQQHRAPIRRQNELQRKPQRKKNPYTLPTRDLAQTASGALNSATDTITDVTSGVLNKGDGGKKSDTLRLRLDLNLDVEITLKARIHGDLELALLSVLPISSFRNFFLFQLPEGWHLDDLPCSIISVIFP